MSEPLMETTQRVNEMVDSTELAMQRFTRCMKQLTGRCEHQIRAIADAGPLTSSRDALTLKNDVLPLLRAAAEMHRQAADWSGAACLGLASRIDREVAGDALESTVARTVCKWRVAMERFQAFQRANEECVRTAMECIGELEHVAFEKATCSRVDEVFRRLMARLVDRPREGSMETVQISGQAAHHGTRLGT